MNRIFVPYTTALLLCVIVLASEARGAADPYAVISKKNLFRPDRTEWIQESSGGTMVDKKIDTSKLSLYGTVIVGNKRSAIIHDKDAGKLAGKPAGKPAGKKNPAEVPSDEKTKEVYSLGDYIGGYVISAIEEKKVVLDYYGEKVTLNLHEGKETAKGDFTPIEETRAAPPPQPAAAKSARPLKQSVQEQRRAKEEMEDQLAAGQIPEALANSPFMSQENMKKLLDFNKDIMSELKESGGNMDQDAIKERVEKFRDRFMEEMGGAVPGAPE